MLAAVGGTLIGQGLAMSAAPAISVNQFWHPFGDTFSQAMAARLGLPRLRPSAWQVADSKSLTVSAGDIVSAVAGTFCMRVVSAATKQVLILNGGGGGISEGLGLSPVEVSGDPQKLARWPGPLGALSGAVNAAGNRIKLPVLPGWNSPIYLGPRSEGRTGKDLFTGVAAIAGIHEGAGIEFGVHLVGFLDSGMAKPRQSKRTPVHAIASHAKALLFAMGFDYLTNAGAGFSELFYTVEAHPDNSRPIAFH